MAEQPKATGGQPISLPKFQNVPVELDQTPSPKQASKRNFASNFMGRPEPLGGSEALRYLVEIGIKSYKPTWDGRPPKRAGHLCGALPDELEDVQAVLCDGRVE